ncbi:MAG: pilus assembly protein PilB, partial [Phycisphaeraceae bacterium]
MAESASSKPSSSGSKSSTAELKGRPLGRILTKMGRVTREQVKEALALQETRRLPLGQLLVEFGYVTQEDVNLALAHQAGMETIDLDEFDIPDDVIRMIPAETAQAYQILPLAYEASDKSLTVALKSADNFRALDDLRLLMGFNVKAVVADPAQVEKKIQTYYGEDDDSLVSLIQELSEGDEFDDFEDQGQSVDLEALLQAADDNKVKRLLNLVLLQAIKDKASDIHFEPFEDEFKMRYRIDGVL